jgi:hypothetical protein
MKRYRCQPIFGFAHRFVSDSPCQFILDIKLFKIEFIFNNFNLNQSINQQQQSNSF